jgi:hypothetical protein
MGDFAEAVRKWLIINHKETKADYKVRKHFLTWIKLDDEFIFQGFAMRATRRSINNNVQNKVKFMPPESIKMVRTLPFSNESTTIKSSDDQKFLITSRVFKVENQTLLNKNADLIAKIEECRNSLYGMSVEQQTKHDYNGVEFFAMATQYAQMVSQPLGLTETSFGMPKRATKGLHTLIDAEVIRLSLSLETLNPRIIAKELLVQIESQLNRMNILAQSLWVLQHNNPIQNDIVKIRTSLHMLKEKLQQSVNNANLLLPIKELSELVMAIKSLAFGKFIRLTPKKANILEQINFRDNDIKIGSDEFNILEKMIFSVFKQTLGIEGFSKYDDNKDYVKTIEQDIPSPITILVKLLEEQQYENEYRLALNRANHLLSTLKETEATGKIKSIIDTINIQITAMGGNSDLAALKGVLSTPPASLTTQIESIEGEHNIGAKWRSQLNQMEAQITNERGTKLCDIFEGKKVTIQEAHKSLKSVIKAMNSTHKSIKHLKSEISRQKSILAVERSQEELNETLNEAIKNLKLSYTEGLTKMQKDDDSLKANLNIFAQGIELKISALQEIIDELEYSTQVVHSGPNGAMMIGLGQGGEQIIRAAMAKMLNTQSDERCENLLTGLNIDLDEIKPKNVKNFDICISDESHNSIVTAFNDANLLAINTGWEQKRMLSQPYNYIWGSPAGIMQSAKDRFIQPTRNTLLLDPTEEGCGGKMGKGRAYAHEAEDGIEAAIRKKASKGNITQVCIVHSFAGGSGSGMILPVLSRVKQVLPNAVIWVFSAGETMQGKSKHTAENVSYITSDVLQSHYNALHHRAKPITVNDWTRFRSSIKEKFAVLERMWGEIYPCISSNASKELEALKEYRKNKFNAMKAKSEIFKKIGFTIPNNDEFEMSTFLPNEPDQVGKFSAWVEEPDNFKEALRLWQEWMALSEDAGSYTIRMNKQLINEKVFGDDADGKDFYYKTSFAHIRSIAKGCKLLEDASNKDEAKEEANRKITAFTTLLNMGIDSNILEESNIKDVPMLRENVIGYAIKMREYHQLIYQMFEHIKLNLSVNDDPLVKHVILSNSHLDKASYFYNGTHPKYEIYNSTMVDVFLNLVHSLVAKNEFDKDNLTAVSSSYEVMDSNDMRNRTKPSIGATLLSLNHTNSINNEVAFDDMVKSTVAETQGWKMFKIIFLKANSPLYDVGTTTSRGTIELELPDENGLMAIYSHYLSDKDGIRRFTPQEVIVALGTASPNGLFLSTEKGGVLDEFWKSIKGNLNPIEKTQLDVEKLEINTLCNMVNWIRLLPPNLIDYIYKNAGKTQFDAFKDSTTTWRSAYEDFFGEDNDPESPLGQEFRRNTLRNFVNSSLTKSTHSQKDVMANLFFKMGLIDKSHIAIIPSALIHEYAPLVMKEILEVEISAFSGEKELSMENDSPFDRSLMDVFFEKNPLPVTRLARSSTNSPWNTYKDALALDTSTVKWAIKTKSESDDAPYLRIPHIRTYGDFDDVWMLDINNKFMRDYSILKEKAINAHPEFGNSTLFDKLVSISPLSQSKTGTRTDEEKPSFRFAREDLEVNASPRKLFASENEDAILIRTMMLGIAATKDKSNLQTMALYKENVKLEEQKWYDNMQAIEISYDSSFEPSKFSQQLKKRLEIFMKQVGEEPNNWGGSNDLTNDILDFIAEIVSKSDILNSSSDGSKTDVFSAKECFDLLHAGFATEWNKINKADSYENLTYDETRLHQNAIQLAGLFSRLSGIIFAAERQNKFESGIMNAGSGVAYEFNGSIDAVRSVGEDFLVVVNASTEVDSSKIESAVNHFYSEYLGTQAEMEHKGKVFIQPLASGPLAHLTIISQQAAVTEISKNYSELMNLLKIKKFGAVAGPAIHPYSFIRNLLWLHTFQDMWLNKPTPQFRKMLEIPDEVITNVFGKPDIIDETENAVMLSGDMTGTTMPLYDLEMWADVNLCSKAIDAGDKDHYKKRLRSQLHVPDMILLNYFRSIVSEDTKNELDMNTLTKNGSTESNQIYPTKNWVQRFRRANLGAHNWSKISKSESDRIDIFGNNPDEVLKSKSWLTALSCWMEWLDENSKRKISETKPDDLDI